ncbi:MAG: hypothetical protein RI953_1860 [Pseudomonadota bacterium]|jgi:ABC-type multidrug transport system fused ATPase/permease subunit
MGMFQEENAPLRSRIFHSWIAPLIRAGRRRPLTLEDLDPVPPKKDSLEETSHLFRQAFSGRLLPALFRTFRARLLKIFGLLFLMAILGLLRPLLLRELIGRYSQRSGATFDRFFTFIGSELSMAIFAIGSFVLLAWLRSHFLRYSFKLTWSMPGLLRHEVYQKLLALSPGQRARLTTGEYVNIATRDCDSTSMIAFLLDPLLYPLMVLVYCSMLVYLLGPWALLAVLLLAGIVPIGRRLERRMSALAGEIREQARLRLGILSEILSGIRVIKFHAWEDSFEKRVLAIREKEINLMRKRARIAAGHSAMSSLLPILTGAIIVSLVSWISKVPSTADVFAAFSVITSLVAIFSETPDLLQNISELRVSLNRIREFLTLPVESAEVTSETSQTLEMTSASYSRSVSAEGSNASAASRALTDISLSVPAGRRVCIVGGVGAGKSTLLAAILGELKLDSGHQSLPKPIAFAPQVPWNQNASVRDNVVFELSWNKDLFDRVIFAAALQTDLQQWPGGADSEVGERGINLSGGQKQRLALARTIYASLDQNIETVLWDDPFSALDESVANHVFKHGLEGLLAGKTRIFTTHRIDFALKSDHVVVMESGRIVEQGAPENLVAAQGAFAKLVRLHESTRGQHLHGDDHLQSTPPTDQPPMSDAGRFTTDEKITLPVFNKNALKIYMKALAPALGLVGVVFIFLLPRLTDIGSNLWLGHWTSHADTIALTQAMLVFAVLTFATVLSERARTVVLFDGGVRAGTTFFKNLMTGVFNAPMRFFDTSPQGRVLNRFTSDTTTIDSSMPSSVGQFIGSLVGIFASILPVAWSQPLTIPLLIPAAILYIWLFKSVRGAQLRLNALSQVVRSPWMSLTAETLPGLSVIRSLQAEERFMRRYRSLINRHVSTGFYVVAVNLWFAFRLEILGVALVGGFVFATTLSPATISTTLAAVGLTFSLQMVGILGGVARSLRFVENALISVDRVNEYSHMQPEQTLNPAVIPEHWPQRGEIEFRHLTASYASDLKPVLNDLSLKIPAASKVGIVGRTGSGKSTLFLALTRMIPIPEGMVFIDGIDLSRVPLKRLRQSISMIPQDPVLFSGTLRENLDPFVVHPDESIAIALRRAHLEHLCPDAETARNFKIEENGRNLSVGERQLVCLARALLARSKILLIDEATANVDVATDAKIQQTLREEFTDCTRLVIAHRTNTLSDVDLLARLDKGCLLEASNLH